jgi:Ca2+-binding RTX toxin-like protein
MAQIDIGNGHGGDFEDLVTRWLLAGNDLGGHLLGQPTPTEIDFYSPAQNATVIYQGTFDYTSVDTLLASPVTHTELYSGLGVGDLVFKVDGLQFTLGTDPQTLETLFNQTPWIYNGANLDDTFDSGDQNDVLHGNGGNDTLLGEGGNDVLDGGLGNDMLDGGPGADSMAGGPGNDIYVIDDPGDSVTEAPSEGFDTVQTPFTRTIDPNVERLVLIGAGDIDASGSSGSDTLVGNLGNNVLDGGRGGDSLTGGAGDDTYKVDSGLDQVTELAGQGTDTIISQVPQLLAANVENLTLADLAGNIEGTGNAANNVIVGNNFANLLDGAAGNDTLKGQGGDDTLLGGAGDDTLSGGLGRDVLVGGAGADHFVFDSVISSGTNVDRIMDFASGQDKIDLSAAIFTGVGTPGNTLNGPDFVSGAGAVAHDASDHVIHDTNTGMVYYDADGSGAQPMVPFAQVAPGQALAAADFHVVA